ncbi:MAG: DUF4411 family protein [Cyclobacteriaceae bacterium]
MNSVSYILDTNVFIEPWTKYYSPKFCTGYFECLNKLGNNGVIAIPEMVQKEVAKVDDDLAHWLLNKSDIPVLNITESVQQALRSIYSHDPKHTRLTDTTKGRSMADPWVIAHAIVEKATVVSKEEKVVTKVSKKVKIPNVCDNMGIRCIQDFEFIEEVGIKFEAKLGV